MNNLDIIQRTPHYQLEKFDNELLLYHPAKTQAVYLNETAALIWNLCDGQRTFLDIQILLQEAYPEMSHQIPQDLNTTLEQLVQQGVIELSSQ
ncbi:MAG: PqqD family protein [Thiomargarita sp.]|nr:PqqD family protein [Thiomargarita sp.]